MCDVSSLSLTRSTSIPTQPAAPNVRRPIKLFRRLFNEHLLDSNCRRHRHRDMTIVVMVVGKHGEHFFADEPRWFAVRDFFPGLRQRQTDAPHAIDLRLTGRRSPHFHSSAHFDSASDANSLTSSASSTNRISRSNLKPILPSSFADDSLSGVVMARTRLNPSTSRACFITARADSKA